MGGRGTADQAQTVDEVEDDLSWPGVRPVGHGSEAEAVEARGTPRDARTHVRAGHPCDSPRRRRPWRRARAPPHPRPARRLRAPCCVPASDFFFFKQKTAYEMPK